MQALYSRFQVKRRCPCAYDDVNNSELVEYLKIEYNYLRHMGTTFWECAEDERMCTLVLLHKAGSLIQDKGKWSDILDDYTKKPVKVLKNERHMAAPLLSMAIKLIEQN